MAPSSVPVRSTSSFHTLDGAITSQGSPLNDVTVSVWPSPVEGFGGDKLTAVTDSSGRYSVSGVRTSVPLVRAAKRGFFTDFQHVAVSQDVHLDVGLDPWVPVAIGAVVKGRIPDTNARCTRGASGWGPKPCERFAITIPARGNLVVTISAPTFVFHLDVVGPSGEYDVYEGFYMSPMTTQIPVEANATYELRVIGGNPAWDSARDFELTTALYSSKK
jgi:hypothetical protein